MQTKHELIPEPIGLDVESLPRPIDWISLFGNDNPIEIEIGMGKGTFITEQAKARPEVNFFGIEWARWFWRYASDRLRRNGCLNARTVRAEASYFLSEFVPAESVSVLHVYFPDPWPKARHHKRRLIQAGFVPLVRRILVPGGRLQVVTDHQGYWEENIEPIIRSAEGFEVVDYNRPGSASDGEFVGTNFERKYAREARPFFAIAAVKSDPRIDTNRHEWTRMKSIRNLIIGVIMCAAYANAAALPKPAIDLPPDKSGNPATAVLAGGCFWCTEAVIEQIDGIIDVVSGYAGGSAEDANYKAVCSGNTRHAEAIRITYDPKKITFGELMQILFTSIDPTQKDRQGNDVGPQYRSAIFYENEEQKKVAEAYIKQLNDAGIYPRPIATTVEPLPAFYQAEDYHQDYTRLNPDQPYIVQCSLPKVRKVRELFKDRMKSTTQPVR